MKVTALSSTFFGVLAALFLVFCGKKAQKETEYVIIGTDTVSVEELSKMAPDTTMSVKKMVLLTSLAKRCLQRKDTATMNEAVKDFNEQLLRESEREWTEESAKNLYCAATAIMQKLETFSDSQSLEAYLNSLLEESFISSDSGSQTVSLDSALDISDTSLAGRKKILASLLKSQFCIDANLSNVITDFVYSESLLQQDTVSVAHLVNGLVFDSAAAEKKEQKKKVLHKKKDNSALALRFRPQESIQKTISEHTTVLEGIYRKELKKDASMAGILYVTFRVAASGEVISVNIKTSQITNKDFISPFLDYVKKINFKPIPEEVGPMTFNFPFEFKPEF